MGDLVKTSDAVLPATSWRILPLAIGAMSCLMIVKVVDVAQAAGGMPSWLASFSQNLDPALNNPATPGPHATHLNIGTTSLPRVRSATLEPRHISTHNPEDLQVRPILAANAPAQQSNSTAAPNGANGGPGNSVTPNSASGNTAAGSPSSDQASSASERALLESLRNRREQLESRESTLEQRALTLEAAESRLNERLRDMDQLRARLEAEARARDERNESNWRGMVRTYEAMRPREAAAIMAELDLSVAIPVMDRMREARLAPILAAMPPDRARILTSELARHRSGSAGSTPGSNSQR